MMSEFNEMYELECGKTSKFLTVRWICLNHQKPATNNEVSTFYNQKTSATNGLFTETLINQRGCTGSFEEK